MEGNKKYSIHLRLQEYLFGNQKLDVNYSIARVMLSQINNIHDITIEEIAYRAHTTPGSVTKCCQKIGYKNFKELKADYHQYRYANVFEDMIRLAGTRGAGAAVDFYVEQNRNWLLEYFELLNHDQIKSIACCLRKSGSGVVLSGLHGFAATNFFCELCNYYGIDVCEINRDAESAMIQSIMETEKTIFIISLMGSCMVEYIETLKITPEIAKKIILITYVDDAAARYRDYCSEVISLKFVPDLLTSNYISSTALSMLFLLIATYINEQIET